MKYFLQSCNVLLIFFVFFVLANHCSGLQNIQFHRRSSRFDVSVQLSVDPLLESVDITSAQASVDVFSRTFLDTFSAKIAGAIIGNIAAGFFLQYISQLFQKKISGTEPSTGEVATSQQVLSRQSIPLSAWLKLLVCIAIDLVGDSSFILPGVGEIEDAVWAPLSTYLMFQLFESNVIAGIEFTKEILPFTDILPLATLVWTLENVIIDTPLNKLLKIPK